MVDGLDVKPAPRRGWRGSVRWVYGASAGIAVAVVAVLVWGLWPTPGSHVSPDATAADERAVVSVPPLVWFRLGQAISGDIAAASCHIDPAQARPPEQSPEETPEKSPGSASVSVSPMYRFVCEKSFDPNGPDHLQVMLVTDNDPATATIAGRLDALFNTVVADNPPGLCKPGEAATPGDWYDAAHPKTHPVGKMLCSPVNGVISWTNNGHRLLAVASREDHDLDKLDTWWHSAPR